MSDTNRLERIRDLLPPTWRLGLELDQPDPPDPPADEQDRAVSKGRGWVETSRRNLPGTPPQGKKIAVRIEKTVFPADARAQAQGQEGAV